MARSTTSAGSFEPYLQCRSRVAALRQAVHAIPADLDDDRPYGLASNTFDALARILRTTETYLALSSGKCRCSKLDIVCAKCLADPPCMLCGMPDTCADECAELQDRLGGVDFELASCVEHGLLPPLTGAPRKAPAPAHAKSIEDAQSTARPKRKRPESGDARPSHSKAQKSNYAEDDGAGGSVAGAGGGVDAAAGAGGGGGGGGQSHKASPVSARSATAPGTSAPALDTSLSSTLAKAKDADVASARKAWLAEVKRGAADSAGWPSASAADECFYVHTSGYKVFLQGRASQQIQEWYRVPRCAEVVATGVEQLLASAPKDPSAHYDGRGPIYSMAVRMWLHGALGRYAWTMPRGHVRLDADIYHVFIHDHSRLDQ